MNGLSLPLIPAPTAGRVARAAVRDHFTATLTRNSVADLQLVVSELVANSVEHGRGTIQLSLQHSVAAIQGSVTDDRDRLAYTPPDFSSHGSTQVWFEITLTAKPPIAPS